MHPTDQSPQQPPYSPDRPPGAAPTVTTGRPWLVATVAFLALLVLIASLGNQATTDSIVKHVRGQSFWDNAVRSVTSTYAWRFSARGNQDFAHVWAASLALVVSVLVLTPLLVAIVSRGRGGFGQAFVGTWLAVVVATLLAAYVRALVVNETQLTGARNSKLNLVLFSGISPGAYQVAAGLGFGFVVALVAGLTARLGRRTEAIGGPPPGGYFPPYEVAETGRPEREVWSPPPVPTPVSGDRPETEDLQHTALLPTVDSPAPTADTAPETMAPPHRGDDRTSGSADEQTAELRAVEGDDAPAQRRDAPEH